MKLFDRLIDDARLLAPGAGSLVSIEDGPWSPEAPGPIRRLVIPDRDLSRMAGVVPAGQRLPVSVLNTSGAGGLLTLARRAWPQLDVAAAESPLRDLDDLAGNAARVVAAAAELAPAVEVFVGLPYAPGWQRAIEVVEAADRYAQVDLAGVAPERTVEQLSALVEADLAFKITGLEARQLAPLLVAVAALVDDADLTEAAQLLRDDPEHSASVIAGWDEATQTRVRRRVLSCNSTDPDTTLALLATAGLIERG